MYDWYYENMVVGTMYIDDVIEKVHTVKRWKTIFGVEEDQI